MASQTYFHDGTQYFPNNGNLLGGGGFFFFVHSKSGRAGSGERVAERFLKKSCGLRFNIECGGEVSQPKRRQATNGKVRHRQHQPCVIEGFRW